MSNVKLRNEQRWCSPSLPRCFLSILGLLSRKWQKVALAATFAITVSIQYKFMDDFHSFDETAKITRGQQPELPFALKKNQTCEINQKLTDKILSMEMGWPNKMGSSRWLEILCPEVVDHFNRFPSIRENFLFEGTPMPVQTTEKSAQSICTMKFVNVLAASINARVYLHAGSHLGAVVHGQSIVWDDDVDMWMDYDKMEDFLEICHHHAKNPVLEEPRRIELHCLKEHNAIKVWLQPEGAKKVTSDIVKHNSPFVDLFLFKYGPNNTLKEVAPTGKEQSYDHVLHFQMDDFFPTQPYYFGGIYLMGPPAKLAEERYTLQNCITSAWNHRLEVRVKPLCIDCHRLHSVFPFVYNSTMKVFGSSNLYEQKLFPTKGTIYDPLIRTSIEQRNQWYASDPSVAQRLTDGLPNLNQVEIDNSISPAFECSGKHLKVVEFNAERGKRWLESAELLKDADVIILNEMDIGMARSDQQHTTRLLAYHLKMNYAWGLEFVELTLGDQGDRENIHDEETNLHGLHGNAILSRCVISDPKIVRDPLGNYFSHVSNGVNAKGLERRLGGRMIMLGRIRVDGVSVVVGSIHKFDGNRQEIIDYIQSSNAIIAGDQASSFCSDIHLDVVTSKHNTWPASCDTFGKHRGDNMCSNMKVAEVYAKKPCVTQFGVDIPLGDHALIGATLEVEP